MKKTGTRTRKNNISKEIENHSKGKSEETSFTAYDGNFEQVISTGSTLLDLAISGNRIRGGGIPSGIMLVAYGPSQSGKTALLSQIAGNILNEGGEDFFNDPEARLDQEFSSMFGMHLDEENYATPDTVTEVFKNLREWKPKDTDVVNGFFTDSLAALSTTMEMDNEDGDKMGGKRAKEFSEALRKHARIIKSKNYIFACSNQVREKMNAMPFESKVEFPGGKALWFYASIVMRFNNPQKTKTKVKIHGKDEVRITGIEVDVIVEKTVDTPYRVAPLIITFGYGIDDIRANLEFVKKYKKQTSYCVNEESIGVSLEKAIAHIEKHNLENDLKNETIDLWEDIERMFTVKRKKKM